jgi:hypothetical protein
MSNVLKFPHDRVKGPRICMTCEVYEFPGRVSVTYTFNPWTWFFAFAWVVRP